MFDKLLNFHFRDIHLSPFHVLINIFNQEAHGPNRSLEKPVQINKLFAQGYDCIITLIKRISKTIPPIQELNVI